MSEHRIEVGDRVTFCMPYSGDKVEGEVVAIQGAWEEESHWAPLVQQALEGLKAGGASVDTITDCWIVKSDDGSVFFFLKSSDLAAEKAHVSD